MQAAQQAIGRNIVSPWTPLLFEYLPPRACAGFSLNAESNGGILAILSNGMTCFYPVVAGDLLDTRTRDRSSFLIGEYKSATGGGRTIFKTDDSAGNDGQSDSVCVYDYPIGDIRSDQYQVQTFHFMHSPVAQTEGATSRPSSSYYRPPRKILLSDDKKKLLILGVVLGEKFTLSLGIFEINMRYKGAKNGQMFELIFQNESSSILDACFTPDSQSFMCITRSYPDRLFVYRLPTAAELNYRFNALFPPRICGPLRVIGPGPVGVDGKPIRHDRVVCMATEPHDDVIYIVTWDSTNPLGEYSAWSIPTMTYRYIQGEIEMEVPAQQLEFKWNTKILLPCTSEYVESYVENESSPKEYIVDAKFAPWDCSNRWTLGFLTQREEFLSVGLSGRGGTYSGLGLRMVDLRATLTNEDHENDLNNASAWFKVLRSPDRRLVSQFCWTPSLSLGDDFSLAVVVREHGLFEISDFGYGSSFQSQHPNFSESVFAFVSIDPTHRYWLKDGGNLKQFTVKAAHPIAHPPWQELFQQQKAKDKQLPWRMLAAKIGYYIQEVESANAIVFSAHNPKGGSGSTRGVSLICGTSTNDDVVCGVHLYRCFTCRKVLLKPLRCGWCGTVIYCSRKCQRIHWPSHRGDCDPVKAGKNS